MAMREVVGTAARMTAGFWSEVARMTEPPGRRSARPGAQRPSNPEPVKAERADAPEPSAAQPEPEPEAVTEGVLVPLDTWTRVMEQLGNLHEAGQELAAARERAARAETQVEFLREQLATERSRSERRQKRTQAAATPPPAPGPKALQTLDFTTQRARVAAARNRVSGWLTTRR